MLRIIATLGAIQMAAIVVNVLRSKMVAVLLGPEGVGVISVVDQIVQLTIQVSAFSLPFAAVKFLSLSHSQGFDAFRRSYSSFLKLLLALTSLGAGIGLLVVLLKPELLGSELSAYRPLLIPALMSVPVAALHGFFSNVMAAARKPRASSFMVLAIAISFTASSVAGILLGGLGGLYWGNLLAGLAVVAGVLIYLRRSLHLPILSYGSPVLQEIRRNPSVVSFALILYAGSFLYPFSYLVARHSVLAGYGSAEAGLLQAAIALAGSINLLLNPANGLYLTPILNRDTNMGERMQAALEFQAKLMLVMALVAMPMVLFPEWLLVILYSPSFLQVSQVVFVFVVAQCLAQLAGVYQAVLIGFNDLKVYGAMVATGHLSFAVLSWLLVPAYGILGVGLGAVVSASILFLVTLARLSSKHGLSLPPRLRFSMAYGLAALLATGIAFSRLDPVQPAVILSKLVLYSAFAAGLLAFLSHEERRQLSLLLRQTVYRANARRWGYALGHAYRRIVRAFSAEI